VRAAGKGFTLLEVLVAVAVLSLALMAAMRSASVTMNSAEALRQRVAADWLASDRLAEHRARRSWPPVGERSGEATQGGIPLRWRERVSATPNARFRRIEVTVLAVESDDTPLAKLTGFAVNRPR
jgi:general secretion pathway protein I